MSCEKLTLHVKEGCIPCSLLLKEINEYKLELDVVRNSDEIDHFPALFINGRPLFGYFQCKNAILLRVKR